MPCCVYVYNMQKTYPTCKKLILVVFFQAAQFLQQVYLEDFPIDGNGFAKNAEVSSLSFDGYTPEIEINHGTWTLGKGETSTNPNHQFLCLMWTCGGCTNFPSMSMLTDLRLEPGGVAVIITRTICKRWFVYMFTVQILEPKNYHGKIKVWSI